MVGSTPVLIFDNLVKDVIIVFLDHEQDFSRALREHPQRLYRHVYIYIWHLGNSPPFKGSLWSTDDIFSRGSGDVFGNLHLPLMLGGKASQMISTIYLHEVWTTGRLGNQMYKKTTDIDVYNNYICIYDCIGNWKIRISLHMMYILHKHPLCRSWRVGIVSTLCQLGFTPTQPSLPSGPMAARRGGGDQGKCVAIGGNTSLSFFMKNGGCLYNRHQFE